MGITNIGNNLDILISCEYNLHDDWQAFAGWYSIYKNLPDANVAVLCARDFAGNNAPFRWPTRAAVKFFQHENIAHKTPHVKQINQLLGTYLALKENLVKLPLLVIDCCHMCVRSLPSETVTAMNSTRFSANNNVWFMQDIELSKIEDSIKNIMSFDSVSIALEHYLGKNEVIPELSNSADNHSLACFTNFSKFDNFDLQNWKEEKQTAPFVYSQGFASPTANSNTRRLLLMWDRMKAAYEVMR